MPIQVDNIYALLAVLVITVVPTVPAILAFIQARRAASKSNETHLALVETQHTVENVEKATNGMKDQLIETTRQAARAAGILEGKAIEKARADAEVLLTLSKKADK